MGNFHELTLSFHYIEVHRRTLFSKEREDLSTAYSQSADIRNEIELDAFVIMPNHIHGIIVINRRGDRPVAPTTGTIPSGPKPKSVGSFVGGFKPMVTKRINLSRNTPGNPVWQRNYYEHVIPRRGRSEPHPAIHS
jgi:hypothetical protein